MSACLAGQATSAEKLLAGHTDFAVVAFTMAVARARKLGVVRNPLESDPDHILIFGNKTDGVRRALAIECTWVVPPPLHLCKRLAGCVCFPRPELMAS